MIRKLAATVSRLRGRRLRYATGGIVYTREPDSDLIPVVISNGCCPHFPDSASRQAELARQLRAIERELRRRRS